MSFESFQQPASSQEGKESLYDPRLEILWDEYGFPGHPPRRGSVAEDRLHEKCEEYAFSLDRSRKNQSLSLAHVSDARQRQLHNEIAIMVVGQKRSGMVGSKAQHIAEFAYEYIKGIAYDDGLREESRES